MKVRHEGSAGFGTVCFQCTNQLGEIFPDQCISLCIDDFLAPSSEEVWEVPRQWAQRRKPVERREAVSGPRFFPTQMLHEEEEGFIPSSGTNRVPQSLTRQKKLQQVPVLSPRRAAIGRKELELDRHFELGASFEQIESLIVEWAELVESTDMKEIRHKLMEEILELLTSSEAVWDQQLLKKFWKLKGPLTPEVKAKALTIVSANVTKWSKQHLQWLGDFDEAVLAIQETHLSPEQVLEARASAQSMGFHWFGGCGSKPTPGIKGGVALMCPAKMHARLVEECNHDGCGYIMIELPAVCHGILLVSLYLHHSMGVNVEPNTLILGRLFASLKSVKNWVVIGDWNVQCRDILSTNIAEQTGGQFLFTEEATTDGGNRLDYCLVSRSLSGLTSVQVEYGVPVKPHVAISARIKLDQSEVAIPQLASFRISLGCDADRAEACIGDVSFELVGTTASFAAFSQEVELAQVGSIQGRGWYNPLVMAPVTQAKFPRQWNGRESAIWHRLSKQLETTGQCTHRLAEKAVQCWQGTQATCVRWQKEVGLIPSTSEETKAGRGIKKATQEAQQQWKQWQQHHQSLNEKGYTEWLQQSMAGGMRALFKAVKTQEATTARPFESEHITARSMCRVQQWAGIWQITSDVQVPPASLKAKAIQQAMTLNPISGVQAKKFFAKMPLKAHGPDGWSIPMLKNLTEAECDALAALFRNVEVTGDVPAQWTISAIVMLPKNEVIERPIALLHTVYKSHLKLRWHLIEQWLPVVRERMPWDAAMPGNATADVAIKRLMRCEASRARMRHHITLYMDLASFYEHIAHTKLIEDAVALGFPELLLFLALSVYQGHRMVIVDGVTSPAFAAQRGVLAGDPIAPILAKIALYRPLAQVLQGSHIVSADVWVDDISLDVDDRSEEKAARQAFLAFQQLKSALQLAGHRPSDSKTFFLASTAQAARALNKIRQPGDPEVKTIGLDLGMATAAGRCRTVRGQTNRIRKANARLRKLQSFKVPKLRKKVRVFSASVAAAGIWGHQSQGISPKVQKTLRMQAANIAHLQKLGSVDVVLDLGEANIKDPAVEVIAQHWRTLSKILCKAEDVEWVERTWQLLWSRLGDAHRWKRVAGPIGAMVSYLRDLGIQAADMRKWEYGGKVIHPLQQYSGMFVAEQFLRDVAVAKRLHRVGQQENAQCLAQGVDWTVPKKILKQCLSGSKQASYYRTAWQGALLTTHKSRSLCPKCGRVITLRHALYDCPFWQECKNPVPEHWQGYEDLPEVLWTRGLVPTALTKMPEFSHGDESVIREGNWSLPFQKEGEQLVFGTDASGGPFSSDPRLRVVAWAVVFGRVKGGQFCFEGQASGRLPQGATITQGEAAAMAFVLKVTTQEARVIADSKASISQAESRKFTAAMHPIWNEVFEDRARLRLEWIKSHQLEEDFIRDHGPHHRWKWQVNSMADMLCGKRSAEVDVSAHAKRVQAVDKIAFEINHFLCDRIKALLMSEVTPALSLLKDAKERKRGGDFRGKQHRPAADGGLNKKERMQCMIDQHQGGHDYEWSRKTSVNWAITCKKCKLYQEQVHALEKFSRIEKQTCAHQAMPWPERWVLGQGHDMYNLGVVWICKRCWATVRPSSDDIAGRLKATCDGKHHKGSKQYGLLLPNEGSVPNQRKTISQGQPSFGSEACKSQQSKLRNFFVSSPGAISQSSSSAVDNKATQAKVQPSPPSKRHRTLVTKEVVLSPPEGSHGQVRQVGQRQVKSPQQAQAKSRSRSSVSRAGQLEVCQRAQESVQVNTQQKQAKTGSPKKKAAVGAKASRKGSCARSQSAPNTASAAAGAPNLASWFQRSKSGTGEQGEERAGSRGPGVL